MGWLLLLFLFYIWPTSRGLGVPSSPSPLDSLSLSLLATVCVSGFGVSWCIRPPGLAALTGHSSCLARFLTVALRGSGYCFGCLWIQLHTPFLHPFIFAQCSNYCCLIIIYILCVFCCLYWCIHLHRCIQVWCIQALHSLG